MEVESQPSYSWWWNSYNKPRQSAWLQATLADLDNKTKAMLSLVQEEADSFAKRADLYYTKRPELINLIEQFYRAHRSLAERYDHLKGETKQNAQKAVQLEHALPCDGFQELPFAKDQIVSNVSVNEGLQEVISMHDSSASDSEISEVDNPEPEVYKIKNEGNSDSNASDSEISEVDNPEPEDYKIKNKGNCDQDNESVSALTSSDSELNNPVLEAAETENINSKLREMETRISDLEEENSRLLRRLTMKSLKSKHLKEKIRRLKKEKSFFKEELFFVDREKSLLQKDSDIVKAEYIKLRNENEAGLQQMQALTRMVGSLQKKNQRFSKQNKVMSVVLGFVNGQAASMARSNVMLRNEMQQANRESEAITQSLKDEKKNQRLSKQYKVMSIVLGFVNEQAASMARSNVMRRKEMQQGNRETEAIIQSVKDEKKNQRLSKQNKVMSIVLGFVNEQAASMARSNMMLRNEMQQVNRETEAIIQSLKDEKKNQRLSKQNKVMSIVLGFVNEQAASMARSNMMLRNEIQQGNRESEAIIQSLKDEKKNQRLSKQNKVMSIVLGFVNEQAASMAWSNMMLRNEMQQGNRETEAIIQSLKNEKKNQRLSKQNKVMSIVLGFVNGQAASMSRSNMMLRNEMQQGNRETEAIIQSLKDEKRNVETMFEAEGKLVSEQNTKIEELQREVCILAEQNREQDIQLLERNEEKREAIRQLSFALETMREKSQRLEEALRNSRAGALCKINTNDSASTQFSTWKKFLVALRGGLRPQPQNHIPARCNFDSLYLNFCEKHTAKVLSLRE